MTIEREELSWWFAKPKVTELAAGYREEGFYGYGTLGSTIVVENPDKIKQSGLMGTYAFMGAKPGLIPYNKIYNKHAINIENILKPLRIEIPLIGGIIGELIGHRAKIVWKPSSEQK